jgi:hypothetical protein
VIELRHETSNFYDREENEGLAVARVLVDLDLDQHVENIERRDKPDVCVRMVGRDPIGVEHRFIDRGEIAFGRYCEAAINAFKSLATKHPRAADLSRIYVIVNIRPDAARPDVEALALEAIDFVCANVGRKMRCERPGANYDLLTQIGAEVSTSSFDGGPVVLFKQGAHAVSMEGLPEALIDAVERKRASAAGYAPTFRPLWLVLTVVDDVAPSMLARPVIEEAMASVSDIDPYDAVIVECPGMSPVVRGNARL